MPLCIHQIALTWSSTLSVPSKTIFWKCSCLSWAREPVKYKCSGICSCMYAHNSHTVQFLPCGVTLFGLKCWCSSRFSFRVDLRRKWCHATKINTPYSALHCRSPTFGQERKGLMTMSKHFLYYRSSKCHIIRLWWRSPLYVRIFIFKWIECRLRISDATRKK